MGALRLGVGVLAAASLVCLPADPQASPWDVIDGQVVPALVVMVIWALPFDALMARVFMGSRPEGREHYARIIRFDLGLLALLALCWGPFFVAALDP